MKRLITTVVLLAWLVSSAVAVDYHGAMLHGHQHTQPPTYCRPGYVWVPLYSWVEWRWDDDIGYYEVIRTRWKLRRATICR